MAVNGRKWIEMAGIYYKFLERAGMAVNGNIQFELAGNGCKLLERLELNGND